MPFPYSVVIFDLDGTLVDSIGDISEALNLTLKQLGGPQYEVNVVRRWVGEGTHTLLATALDAAGLQAQVADVFPLFSKHYDACLLNAARLYPGVIEALRALSDVDCRLAICTNKPSRCIAPLLAHLGVAGYFLAGIGGDTLPKRKPHALPLLHLAQHFGVAPDACLMVGDSGIDFAAAQSAQMPCALVRYGYSRGFDVDSAGAVMVVDDLRQLLLLDEHAVP